jgi:aminoglycoside phosphotransferase family enzyme
VEGSAHRQGQEKKKIKEQSHLKAEGKMFTRTPLSGMVNRVCFSKIRPGRREFMNGTLPKFITFLQDPRVYGHPVDEVRLVQTHISYVLIAGDRVYKFKKPVDFGFLDFTTLEKRKFFCEQELILNRRLCPDIYLDLVTVTRSDTVLALNGDGEVVEFGIRMKRMPEEGMMGNYIASGKLSKRHIDLIVDTLIPFYERAAGDAEIGAFGRAEAVAVNVLENFDQTEGFIGCEALNREQYEKISGYAGKFLENKSLFEKRIAAQRIRDCHGDLYSANICFDGDRVHIFDCIEFNKRFRYADVASDIAFLAMDLDFHSLQELSEYFTVRFKDKSGDAELYAMLNFYKCYRAYVRGKIGLFTAHDRKVDTATKDNCLRMAKRYFNLAERYAGA